MCGGESSVPSCLRMHFFKVLTCALIQQHSRLQFQVPRHPHQCRRNSGCQVSHQAATCLPAAAMHHPTLDALPSEDRRSSPIAVVATCWWKNDSDSRLFSTTLSSFSPLIKHVTLTCECLLKEKKLQENLRDVFLNHYYPGT